MAAQARSVRHPPTALGHAADLQALEASSRVKTAGADRLVQHPQTCEKPTPNYTQTLDHNIKGKASNFSVIFGSVVAGDPTESDPLSTACWAGEVSGPCSAGDGTPGERSSDTLLMLVTLVESDVFAD